jgi:hypothetical protein
MNAVIAPLASAVAVVLWDWAGTSGLARYARLFDFDYRYWPPSKARIASLALLWLAATICALFAHPNPEKPSIWILFVIGPALILWSVIGLLDFFAQSRTGYRKPPSRYSDPSF